jgi:hypothetical protein
MNVESVVKELATYNQQIKEIQEQSRKIKIQLNELVGDTLRKYIKITKELEPTPTWPWVGAELQWHVEFWDGDLWVVCTWSYNSCGEWCEEGVNFWAELLYKPNAMQEYEENVKRQIEYRKQQQIEKEKEQSRSRKQQLFRTADEMGYTLVPKNE